MRNTDASSGASGTADETPLNAGEIEALRAENRSLQAQIDRDHPTASGSGVRRFFAWLLAIISIISIIVAATVGWAETTLLDADEFVATLAPLPRDEAVAEALSTRIGDTVVEATDLEAVIAEALPDGLAFIATPVSSATSDAVAAVAERVIVHDAFTAVWTRALRTTHEAVLLVLTGKGAIVAEDGAVAIDLDTIAEPVVVSLAERGLDLGTLVADDFTLGQIVIVESDALGQAQAVVHLVDTLGWFTLLIALLFVAAAMAVASDRRRQVAIIGFGTAIAGLINLILLRIGRGLTVGSIGNQVDRRAGLAVWNTLVQNLTSLLWAVVFLALVVGIAAWFVGPGARARRLRDATGVGVDRWRGQRQAPPSGLNLFFSTWRRPLEWGVLVLGIAVLLVTPVVSLGVPIVVVLIGFILIGAIELIAGPPSPLPDEVVDRVTESVDAD